VGPATLCPKSRTSSFLRLRSNGLTPAVRIFLLRHPSSRGANLASEPVVDECHPYTHQTAPENLPRVSHLCDFKDLVTSGVRPSTASKRPFPSDCAEGSKPISHALPFWSPALHLRILSIGAAIKHDERRGLRDFERMGPSEARPHPRSASHRFRYGLRSAGRSDRAACRSDRSRGSRLLRLGVQWLHAVQLGLHCGVGATGRSEGGGAALRRRERALCGGPDHRGRRTLYARRRLRENGPGARGGCHLMRILYGRRTGISGEHAAAHAGAALKCMGGARPHRPCPRGNGRRSPGLALGLPGSRTAHRDCRECRHGSWWCW
jgi:hypothetical protein